MRENSGFEPEHKEADQETKPQVVGPERTIRAKNRTEAPANRKAKVINIVEETGASTEGDYALKFTVDLPVESRYVRRVFKFVIPKEFQATLTENRPRTAAQIYLTEKQAAEYNRQANEFGDFNIADGLKGSQVKEGQNEVLLPKDLRVEMFLQMLKDNHNDLRPKFISFDQRQGEEGTMFFTIDNQPREVSFTEVKRRVEFLMKKKELFEAAIKYKRMGKKEFRGLPRKESQVAEAILLAFQGIPSAVLERAKNWGDKLARNYPKLKIHQQQKKGRPLSETEQEQIRIFEALGLFVKDGKFSLADETLNEALIKRLEGLEPLTENSARQARQDFLERAGNKRRLLIDGIKQQLLQAPTKQLEAFAKKLSPEVKESLVAMLGYDLSGVWYDLEKSGILSNIEADEVCNLALRLARDMAKVKAKKSPEPDFSDKRFFYFEKGGTFKDPENFKTPPIVQKVVQKGTERKFLMARLEKKVRARSELEYRLFFLPLDERQMAQIDSDEKAKRFRDSIANIFFSRHEREGQRLSFQPFVEKAGGTATNPKFKLTLGESSGSVSYKEVFASLSFKERVEAELFKETYLDSKEGGQDWWQQAPEWERQKIYRFQNILTGSGFPSLTEQLLVRELERKNEAPLPLAFSQGKAIRIIRPEKGQVLLKPEGSISPEEIARLRAYKVESAVATKFRRKK